VGSNDEKVAGEMDVREAVEGASGEKGVVVFVVGTWWMQHNVIQMVELRTTPWS
jgi:hypothetical protein